MVLFLVLINLTVQDHVRLGVRLGTGGCSVAASSALPRSLPRRTVQDSPTRAHSLRQRCQLWQTVRYEQNRSSETEFGIR